MTANNIIADQDQNSLVWSANGDGYLCHTKKAYLETADTNPIFEIKLVDGTYYLGSALYGQENLSVSGTVAALKAQAALLAFDAGVGSLAVTPSDPYPTGSALTNAGDDVELNLKASGAWTAASGAAWLTLDAESGTGSATVTATVAANAGAARNTTVTFTNTVTSETVVVTIYQASA